MFKNREVSCSYSGVLGGLHRVLYSLQSCKERARSSHICVTDIYADEHVLYTIVHVLHILVSTSLVYTAYGPVYIYLLGYIDT